MAKIKQDGLKSRFILFLDDLKGLTWKKWLAIIFVLTTLVSLGLTQSKLALNSIQKAVIFEREIEIWGEPNTRADILFLLHEGTDVEVVDALEGWSKVKLANGSEGWIQNSGIKGLN